jgi:tetratricopeptide (TPR) repeat protein
MKGAKHRMRDAAVSACYLLLLLFARFESSPAQRLSDEPLHATVLHGIELTMQQRYDEALRLFRTLTQQVPEAPFGYLYQCGVLEARAMDLEIIEDEERIEALLDQVIPLARKMTEQKPRDPWAYYYLGSAFGYYANHHLRIGNLLRGFSYCYKAKKEFLRCLDVDSTFYDAYVGVGMFQYWRSKKTETLNWLPFLGDEREDGVRHLQLAEAKGTYNRFVALNWLARIMLDTGRDNEAADYCERVLRDFPDNRIFLWWLGQALETSNPLKARPIYH